jgi:hypothetical protein
MRVTLDVSDTLYTTLREQAASAGVSIESLILEAVEQSSPSARKLGKGRWVTGPMVKLGGKLGPRFPVDENPHDLIIG